MNVLRVTKLLFDRATKILMCFKKGQSGSAVHPSLIPREQHYHVLLWQKEMCNCKYRLYLVALSGNLEVQQNFQ